MSKTKAAPRVYCTFTRMVPLEELIPNPRNPKRHPEEQVDLLAKIIHTQGWRNPIVVSNRSGFITKGHARLDAAKKLGRKCYGLEIDPHYCSVILDRWAAYTGKDPIMEDGTTWSSLKKV